MKSKLPSDPFILFSYINMQLRNNHESLQEFCDENNADIEEILQKLEAAGFSYIEEINQFR